MIIAQETVPVSDRSGVEWSAAGSVWLRQDRCLHYWTDNPAARPPLAHLERCRCGAAGRRL